ncbi:myb-like protein X [Triplophysa dalaica]|uniref:myb-like protein X n=1 Tax=Triplophysa dalaica TaxID=1582913 RepID=UPI0024DF79BA|nr:myb-like protein X [Triplophysa dalaica]
MSGRRSKKNQKLGSSRRGNRGLRVNEEKDNEFDGPDEVHTTNPSDDTVLEAQFDHLPCMETDNQTTALECSPRAESTIHKASDVEADLPERKRKIGSTRKKAGELKNRRNLEPCDEVRTSEEFGEEQENQLNTSTTEEEHTYQTKNEQQTQRSGSGGELGVAQNIMVTVSQSKETDAIHHQEISSYGQTSRLEAGSNMAMEQSTAQSNVVTMSRTEHETLLVSSVQKRKMGSTRRPLGGNREQNRENVEVEELFRNTTDDVWKAEVKSSEAEFSILEEMMQTWDDVKRISPTNTPSHTESALVSNQPLSSERTEELDVSVETETNNRSVACSVIDSTKPPSDRFGNHENLFPNKELVCFKLGLETDNHAEDFNVFQNVSDLPPTRSENFLEEVGGFSDTYQDLPHSRHNTSEDCGSVTLVETKEEPCRSDPNIIISSSKQDTEIDKLLVNVEETLSSPCPLDVATKYGNSEIPTDELTAKVGRISETLESDITHSEPTKIESTPKMTDPGPDRHGLEDEEKETLMEAITSGQEMKMEEEYTQSERLEHKEENMNIQATDDFVEQEIQSDMQQGKTRKGLHSANETNVSDSSLSSANCNLANVSPVTEHLHNVNMNFSSLMPEDSKLSGGVMVETVVSSGLNDLIINNQVSHVIVPEAENRDIYVEIKEGNDIDVLERSITCDVTVTENVLDVENFTEQSVDPQTLATRENENVGTKTGSETDALEIKDQDNVENNAKDDMIMQILKNKTENEEDEGDTKDREKQPGSQIQGSPSRVDPDKESYDFFQDTSVENAEESLLNAKSESAFDREGKTCEKYKMIEESGGHEKMDASAVSMIGVTEPLANIPDNDIRSDLQPEEHSSHINFEGLMQDAVTESSLESSAVPEQTELSIIPEDSQGVQKKDGASEGVAEKDRGLEFQEQNNVMDQNIKQTMMVLKGDEHEMTKKVRRSTEQCDDEADKAEGHAEITSEQQQRSSLNISQKQDGPPHDDSENMFESETEEMFLRANTVHAAFERMIETNDESKEIEEDFKEIEAAEHLTNVNIQDNANKSDLQTENPEQNKVLTEGPHINLEELQESTHAKNVTDVTDSGLSFEDPGESYMELENINEILEDFQKEEKQSTIKPLVHKRKMRGNKRQRKDREQDDDSETLNNEEKEEEREKSGGKDTGPVEELDSTIIQSSCNAEKSTEESSCDITESQTTTKCHGESQENAGDIESLPTGGDTEAHLEIQTDIGMLDSTMNKEGTEENICDDDVLMRQVVFVGDTVTEESNMTIESDLLQNNTSLDTHQELLKSSENVENVSAVTDSGLLLQDVVLVGSGETEAVSEEPEISNTSENSQRDSSSTLNLLAHKRKMGSTRRPLRGNTGQQKDREQDDENETLNSESLINEDKSTEERLCDITESQTTTQCYAESQETAGDVASLPIGGDKEAHLEIQTDINMFDSTIIEEGTEGNICNDDVLTRHVEFVGDTVTEESNMTIESDLLQNNTSLIHTRKH